MGYFADFTVQMELDDFYLKSLLLESWDVQEILVSR